MSSYISKNDFYQQKLSEREQNAKENELLKYKKLIDKSKLYQRSNEHVEHLRTRRLYNQQQNELQYSKKIEYENFKRKKLNY